MYSALQSLTNAPVDFATSMVSFERVFEVIDLPTEIKDKPSAVSLEDVKGEIIFDNVSFKYDIDSKNLLHHVKRLGQMDNIKTVLSGPENKIVEDKENNKSNEEGNKQSQAREDALDNLSFSVEPGQLVALVGPSGAGKTTLTYLIPRLYDPTDGKILIDGVDLRNIKLDYLK